MCRQNESDTFFYNFLENLSYINDMTNVIILETHAGAFSASGKYLS